VGRQGCRGDDVGGTQHRGIEEGSPIATNTAWEGQILHVHPGKDLWVEVHHARQGTQQDALGTVSWAAHTKTVMRW